MDAPGFVPRMVGGGAALFGGWAFRRRGRSSTPTTLLLPRQCTGINRRYRVCHTVLVGDQPPLVLPLPPLRTFCAPLFAFNLHPHLVPPIIADRIPQRQHRIDVRFRPVHARPFHPLLHHQLIGALHAATPDRPSGRLEARIVHLIHPLLQVRQLTRGVPRRVRRRDQPAQLGQHTGWASMLEIVT